MQLGPTLPWFSCISSDKTIMSFYAAVLHLKNENITSHFSPLEARVKINLQKTPWPWNLKFLRQVGQKDKTRLKRSWRTDVCLRNKGVADGFHTATQTDTTLARADRWHSVPCWVWGSADWACHGWSPRLRCRWGHAAPCWGHHELPLWWQIFQIFLAAESAGVAPTARWAMPRVCCLNSFLTPEGTEAFLSLAQQLPLGSQCLPTYQPSRLQLFHMLRIWNFCGNRQISKC